MRHLTSEFLNGDQSFLTDQKPGETIFESVPGFIDFLKPSTEERRIKQQCSNCGFVSTTMIHHVEVSTYSFMYYIGAAKRGLGWGESCPPNFCMGCL